jgi:eukaryotic-like serine/threonine-protein kinase
MVFKTRVWGAGKIILLGGGLIATYLLFAAASMRLALRMREVQVPDLTDRSANEATALANDLGLALKIDDTRRPDPKIGAGRVLMQDPPAGAVARRQRTVRVWLSAGQRSSTVPALVGESERTAQFRLSRDGLTLAAVAEIRSAAFPQDVVIAQTPAAKAASGRVSLLVNRGARGVNYVMPDLIGVNGDRAAEILRNRGFRVAVVASTPYPGVAGGIVIRQSPQAGFQIAPGEPISLEVSR